MSLPSAATSFDGGATYYYGGGGSPPFSLVYFLVRLSLLLLLWLLQSSRHDEIRKLLLGRRRRRRRRSSTAASLRANTRKLHGMKSWSWHFSRFDSIPTIYIYILYLFFNRVSSYVRMCFENPILHWWKSQYDISRVATTIVVENLKWCFIFDEKLLPRRRRRRQLFCFFGISHR